MGGGICSVRASQGFPYSSYFSPLTSIKQIGICFIEVRGVMWEVGFVVSGLRKAFHILRTSHLSLQLNKFQFVNSPEKICRNTPNIIFWGRHRACPYSYSNFYDVLGRRGQRPLQCLQ